MKLSRRSASIDTTSTLAINRFFSIYWTHFILLNDFAFFKWCKLYTLVALLFNYRVMADSYDYVQIYMPWKSVQLYEMHIVCYVCCKVFFQVYCRFVWKILACNKSATKEKFFMAVMTPQIGPEIGRKKNWTVNIV